MSTTLLYHAWGIHGYHYVRQRHEGGQTTWVIAQARSRLRCPVCVSADLVCRGETVRNFRTVPVGCRPVFIELAIPRVECRRCLVVRQVRVSFADGQRSYTKSFERYVLELSHHMTIQAVARLLGVGWDMVKEIQERNLSKRFGRIRASQLRCLAIDEICVGKGHRYLTIVMDLITGAVVFVGDGKGAEALDPFWKKLGRFRSRIEAVAMDMGPAYRKAVADHLPQAVIVFDHFHVVKLFNEKLSTLRRSLQRKAETDEQKQVIKGTRWLLLKNPDNLDEGKNEPQRLAAVLALNQPLATAYILKEALRLFWNQPNKAAASAHLSDWIATARAAGIAVLKTMANTLASCRDGLLAYYDSGISTGPLESMNLKIGNLQRRAFGYRDMDFFKLRILSLHEATYAITG